MGRDDTCKGYGWRTPLRWVFAVTGMECALAVKMRFAFAPCYLSLFLVLGQWWFYQFILVLKIRSITRARRLRDSYIQTIGLQAYTPLQSTGDVIPRASGAW